MESSKIFHLVLEVPPAPSRLATLIDINKVNKYKHERSLETILSVLNTALISVRSYNLQEPSLHRSLHMCLFTDLMVSVFQSVFEYSWEERHRLPPPSLTD